MVVRSKARSLAVLWVIVCLEGLVGCLPWRSQRQDQEDLQTELLDWENFLPLEPSVGFESLKKALLNNGPDLDAFMHPGPVSYRVHENRLARWRDGSFIVYDNVIPSSASPIPLVILVHGNHSHKEAHRYQAERLASYGIHAIVLQVPNQDQWVLNGERVRRFVQRVRKNPKAFGKYVDPNNIIVAGHSFGGSAVTIAAGRGAKVKGVILLDPAVVSDSVLHYMRGVQKPTLLLSSDPAIFRARRQQEFSQNIGGEFVSIGIAGSTHDDAQFPSMYSHAAFGYDPFTSDDKQQVFAAALTMGAFSLGATGKLAFAADAISPLVGDGDVLSLKKRPAQKSVMKTPLRSKELANCSVRVPYGKCR